MFVFTVFRVCERVSCAGPIILINEAKKKKEEQSRKRWQHNTYCVCGVSWIPMRWWDRSCRRRIAKKARDRKTIIPVCMRTHRQNKTEHTQKKASVYWRLWRLHGGFSRLGSAQQIIWCTYGPLLSLSSSSLTNQSCHRCGRDGEPTTTPTTMMINAFNFELTRERVFLSGRVGGRWVPTHLDLLVFMINYQQMIWSEISYICCAHSEALGSGGSDELCRRVANNDEGVV